MSFEVGDEVMWRSQAAGRPKEKRGTIVQIVFPGDRPSRERFPSLVKGGIGQSRKLFSYVIKVGGKRSHKHYWPHASRLRKIEPAQSVGAVDPIAGTQER